MEKICLNFFGEKVEIKIPTNLESLRNAISEQFLFDPSDAAEVIIGYIKDLKTKIIKTEEDFRYFLKEKISQINLDISQESRIYKENYTQYENEEIQIKNELDNLIKEKDDIIKKYNSEFIEEKNKIKEIKQKINQLKKEKQQIKKNLNNFEKKFNEIKQKQNRISEIRKKLNLPNEDQNDTKIKFIKLFR